MKGDKNYQNTFKNKNYNNNSFNNSNYTKGQSHKSYYDRNSEYTVTKPEKLLEDNQFIGDLDKIEYIDHHKLKHFCKKDPENVKVVEVACPINSNLMVLDISLNPKGIDEELVYLKHPEYIKNIRRGNTLVEIYHYDDDKGYVYDDTFFARKGMMKFVDLPKEIIETKDDYFLRTDHITEESKLNARNVIMCPVLKTFEEKSQVEVIKIIKANGENAQVSYLKKYDMWVVASKNVSILVKNRGDLENYYPIKENGESSRYKFAYIIGHCWFDVLEKLKPYKGLIQELKEFMNNKTFIGEYVGNQNHQHLIRYVKHTILFFAVLENTSQDNSFSVEDAYSAFRKFKLDMVPYENLGVFNDHKSLCETLNKVYNRVAESSIIDEEEGSVLYLSRVDKNSKKILVLCKLKTLEYRVYRKLREKLKNHLTFSESRNSFDSRRKINQFFDEVRVMLQGYILPMPMSFYYKVAETAFAFANKYNKNCIDLHSSYIDFLETIHSIIDNTVDLKSRVIKGDNIMTYDTLIKNVIKSKKVIEIIIYSPPLYLSEDFLKKLEKVFETEIRNSFILSKDYINVESQVLIYHINMHNFRAMNKLEENKLMMFLGFSEEGFKKSMEVLVEKIKNPQFISYNKNTSLTPFLNNNEKERKRIFDEYIENSKIFLERSKKYLNNKIIVNETIENEDLLIQEVSNTVSILKEKISKLDLETLKKENFINDLVDENEENKNSKTKMLFDNNKTKPQLAKSTTNKFISLYENHINNFLSLKEEFVKTGMEEIQKLDLSSEVDQINLNSVDETKTNNMRTIIILVPMTIPGTGKTFFVDGLQEILKKFEIGFASVSSDNIRRSLIDDLVKRSKMSEADAFNASGKDAAYQFEQDLKRKFRNLVNNYNKSLLYLDKNHPPNAISRVFEPLRNEIKKFNKYDLNVQYIALLPDCYYPISLGETKKIFFSLSYFIQCFVRVRNRKNHPTLNGDNKNLLCILAMFINNFMNFELSEQNLIMHYEFNKAIKLPFTNEMKEDELPKDLVQAAFDFLNNMPKGNAIPQYDKRAETLENMINKYYSDTSKFKCTKDLVKETAEPIIKKLYTFQSNETSKDTVAIKKIFKSSNPTKFIYLCLLVSNNKSTSLMYDDIIIPSLDKFSKFQSNLTEAISLKKSLALNDYPRGWKPPHDSGETWHITTLYKGNGPVNDIIKNDPAYKEFVEGEKVSINVHGLVYVPTKIIFSVATVDKVVGNEFPHITTLLGAFKPKQSHDVMKVLFGKGCELENFYSEMIKNVNGKEEIKKCIVKLDGMTLDCYIIKFAKKIVLDSEMKAM